jgi:secondary thiamine-phosphate synthase enzyme
MKQSILRLDVATSGKGFFDVTAKIGSWVAEQEIGTGLLTVFIRHTSASLVIQENADPTVLEDLNQFFEKTAPESSRAYRHSTEGTDDMPAHIRSAITQTQLSIPVIDGRLGLGTWQGIFVCEHRARPHARSLILHLIGD